MKFLTKKIGIYVATANLPKLNAGFIEQNGAIYSLRARIIDNSLRVSGVDGDAIRNTSEYKIRYVTFLKMIFKLLLKRKFIFNSNYAGPFFSNFGHFLIETLTRLEIDQKAKPKKYVYHTMDSDPNFQNVLEYQSKILGLLNIDSKQIKILKDDNYLLIKAKILENQVIFPKSMSSATNLIYDKIVLSNKSHLNFGEKIYVSRSLLPKEIQRLVPDTVDKLEELFKEYDFKVINPETLDIYDQISIISKAKFIAGPQGSSLHLTVFAKPHTVVVEIGDSFQTIHPNTQQKIICETRGQNFYFIPYETANPHFDYKKLRELLDDLIY
jgi:capsular polysaccharide biosynthesis protein